MKRLLLATACALAIVACSSGANQYVGHWVNVKDAKDTMVIKENGSTLLITDTSPDPLSGAMDTENFPGVIKDRLLQVQAPMGTATFVIDKSTGHLTAEGDEYKRLSK